MFLCSKCLSIKILNIPEDVFLCFYLPFLPFPNKEAQAPYSHFLSFITCNCVQKVRVLHYTWKSVSITNTLAYCPNTKKIKLFEYSSRGPIYYTSFCSLLANGSKKLEFYITQWWKCVSVPKHSSMLGYEENKLL